MDPKQIDFLQMTIEPIEIEIDINNAIGNINQVIEAALQKWGEPLRWAITTVDRDTNIARVEAIVIKERSS
jgi:hypothetical protein